MPTLPPSFKICATCVFWAGAREAVSPFYNYVKFDSNTRGKCCGGGFNHAQMIASASCNKWQKWPVLK